MIDDYEEEISLLKWLISYTTDFRLNDRSTGILHTTLGGGDVGSWFYDHKLFPILILKAWEGIEEEDFCGIEIVYNNDAWCWRLYNSPCCESYELLDCGFEFYKDHAIEKVLRKIWKIYNDR